MSREIYRYAFNPHVSFAEAVAKFHLALIAVESLHGEARARMDARFAGRPLTRSLAIDASTDVGLALNQIFQGYLRREFGDASFSVSRCPSKNSPTAAQAAHAEDRGPPTAVPTRHRACHSLPPTKSIRSTYS